MSTYEVTGSSAENVIMRTRPDAQPTATVDAVTAECNGRYSEGSHSKFSESFIIHMPSELIL